MVEEFTPVLALNGCSIEYRRYRDLIVRDSLCVASMNVVVVWKISKVGYGSPGLDMLLRWEKCLDRDWWCLFIIARFVNDDGISEGKARHAETHDCG